MKGKMRGIVKDKADIGAVLINDLPIPATGDRDVLVKVKATAICGTDIHIYNWNQYAADRVKLPMVFGHEFAGDIVEVGKGVTEYKVGDRVAGETHIPCNHCYQCRTNNRHICENMQIIGVHTQGAFADYISFPADCVWKLNNEISYEDAALLEPMGVAVHGISAGDVRDKTVVIGGCGPIGLMAVGAAKYYKAKKIIALDIVPAKLAIAGEMGADIMVNSRDGNAVEQIKQITEGKMADVVIDYTGNDRAIIDGMRMVRKGGCFVAVGLPSKGINVDFTELIIYKELTVVGVTGRRMYETWEECDEILKSGQIDLKKIIGGVYPLQDFEKGFELLASGIPGKVLLIP